LPSVTMFPYPLPGASTSITVGADHALWFTEHSAVDRLDPSTGAVTEYPTYGFDPSAIVSGSDGDLYFGEEATPFGGREYFRIGRIDPTTGGSVELTPPGAFGHNVSVVSTAAGADGDVYFASDNKILRLVPSTGAMRVLRLPGTVFVTNLANGSHGVLTLTYDQFGTGKSFVGQLNTTTGKFAKFAATSHNHPLGAITEGPGGRFYFVEYGDRLTTYVSDVGAFDPATHSFRFETVSTAPGTSFFDSGDIAAGPDGNIYFSDPLSGFIGQWNLSTGTINRILSLGGGQQPAGLTFGPDGALYFTNAQLIFADAIGRFTLDGQ
jgi:streptogramin lyase